MRLRDDGLVRSDTASYVCGPEQMVEKASQMREMVPMRRGERWLTGPSRCAEGEMGRVTRVFNRPSIIAAVLLAAHAMAIAPAWAGSNAAPATVSADKPITIVAFGDSLTAGYQLPLNKAFPAQLQAALTARGHNVTVINSGVSGDTTGAGLQRFDWAVPDTADAVIVELGANDFLRGIDPDLLRANLVEILEKLKARQLPVLLAGMQAPDNYGPEYKRKAETIYADLAALYNAELYPFFLEGVARDPKLSLADGLHPNADGVEKIVQRILPRVEKLIRIAAKADATSAP